MTIKQGFILRRFADKWLAVCADDSRNALITLNKTGAFVWERLQSDTTREALIHDLTDRFDVSEDVAEGDVDAFLQKAREAELLDE